MLAQILRAEDQRRSGDIPEAAWSPKDVKVRRAAARAISRILGSEEVAWPPERLFRLLHDEDSEVVSWAAYGLGLICKEIDSLPEARGRQGEVVSALVARAVTLETTSLGADAGRSALLPLATFARALGQCGTPAGEASLASWLLAGEVAVRESAVYALGDIASHEKTLHPETIAKLLEATRLNPPFDVAFYPWTRLTHVPRADAMHLFESAEKALTRPSEARIFAIRALARVGGPAINVLSAVVQDGSFASAERNEAARGLSMLGAGGRAALRSLLVKLGENSLSDVRGRDSSAFVLLTTLLEGAGDATDEASKAMLFRIANAELPKFPASLVRRVESLRCKAASVLAKEKPDAEVLLACASRGSSAFGHARLAALTGGKLDTADKKGSWLALTRSPRRDVREAALESISSHPELKEVAKTALAEALLSDLPGVVGTAADVIHEHPERVLLAASPSPLPLVRDAGREPAAIDPQIEAALSHALSYPFAEDLVETTLAVIDAALAVGLQGAKGAAEKACHSANITVRRRAEKALAAASPHAVSCPAPLEASAAARDGALLAGETKVTFDTDVGPLSIVFEPELAPFAATRLVELARSGFFHEIVVHRVVPGFVAQFGDPGGDGYGGAGKLLRCETSPLPFAPLDVGVALAGRDTGSSQIFVTLARTPHLDGQYARIGRASGPWADLAQGDMIKSARVE